MCFHLFTNSLNYFTNYSKSHKFAYKNAFKNKVKCVFFHLQTLFTNYNKSHKFNANERPHEQSSRIKLPSTLPVFLITGAAKRTA